METEFQKNGLVFQIEFFLRMPESYGAILNPGYVSQLIIPPTGVSEFRKDLKGG
jgi:hypothetical protein